MQFCVWVSGKLCAGVGVLPSSVARVLGLVAGLHGVFENAADICLGILFHLCLWSVVCGVWSVVSVVCRVVVLALALALALAFAFAFAC